jgi:hypothetical protein
VARRARRAWWFVGTEVSRPGLRPAVPVMFLANSGRDRQPDPRWLALDVVELPPSASRCDLDTPSQRAPGLGNAGGHSSHSVTNVGFAWTQTRFAGVGPWLMNLCGVSGGTITMSPGPASSC